MKLGGSKQNLSFEKQLYTLFFKSTFSW